MPWTYRPNCAGSHDDPLSTGTRRNEPARVGHGALPDTPVGRCRVCGRWIALISDGTVRLHLKPLQDQNGSGS